MSDPIRLAETSEPCLRLYSPGFEATYPVVRHIKRIPQERLFAMEASWKKPFFEEKCVKVYCLENVYVVEEGLVFDATGQLFEETITQHSVSEIERGRHAVQLVMLNPPPPVDCSATLCKKRGAQNYGHWLIEMLTMAYISKSYLGHLSSDYLVAQTEELLSQAMFDSLAMLGINKSNIHTIGSNPIFVKRLFVVAGLTAHGSYMSPLVLGCMDVISAHVSSKPVERLYVSRRGAHYRNLEGEEDICSYAKSQGFVVVTPGEMSLAEQIAVFKGARQICGVAGAAMTNIVFAPRNASVITLFPETMPDTFFWFLANLRGQCYAEVRCLQTGPVCGVSPWDQDLALSPDDIYYVFSNKN
jgi:capsular polysaccharide biosynthesis protein